MNIALLAGRLTTDPVIRTLGSGDVVWSVDVATTLNNSPVRVPLSWINPPATDEFVKDAEVVVSGAVKRRFFATGGATQSRVEVMITTMCLASQRRRVSALLRRAQSQLCA